MTVKKLLADIRKRDKLIEGAKGKHRIKLLNEQFNAILLYVFVKLNKEREN